MKMRASPTVLASFFFQWALTGFSQIGRTFPTISPTVQVSLMSGVRIYFGPIHSHGLTLSGLGAIIHWKRQVV